MKLSNKQAYILLDILSHVVAKGYGYAGYSATFLNQFYRDIINQHT